MVVVPSRLGHTHETKGYVDIRTMQKDMLTNTRGKTIAMLMIQSSGVAEMGREEWI